MQEIGQYGPRDRLLLCRDASGSTGHSHEGCMDVYLVSPYLASCVDCLLSAQCLLAEGRGAKPFVQAGENA